MAGTPLPCDVSKRIEKEDMRKVRVTLGTSFFLLPLLCSGCGPLPVIGAGATVVTAAAEERGLEGIASDARIRSQINYLWLTKEPNLIDQVELSVQSGCVVLTGFVENARLKAEAVRLVRQVDGVTAVYDETQIGPEQSWSGYTRDAWMGTKLKTALLGDENIRSRNYSIRVVDKVVYLMGIAQDQQELNLVLAHARDTANVRRVVNHVQLKQDVKNLPDMDGPRTTTPAFAPPSPAPQPNQQASASGPVVPSAGTVQEAPATPLPPFQN